MDTVKKPNDSGEGKSDISKGMDDSRNVSEGTLEPPATDEAKLSDQQGMQQMDLETQNRLRAFLEVAGVKLSHVDTRTFQDPEILRKLTNW